MNDEQRDKTDFETVKRLTNIKHNSSNHIDVINRFQFFNLAST